MANEFELLKPKEVSEMLKVGSSRAYEIINTLNAELEEKGFYVIKCRINKAYLIKRMGNFTGDNNNADI